MASKPRLPTLIFEVTRNCNHSCAYCYNFWRRPGYGDPWPPETEDLRPLLGHILDQVDTGLVTLSGGEPLLRPDLPEIVSFLASRDMRVNLISNGHGLTDPLAADLIGRGVGLFELPLLGYRRATQDALSGAAGSFDAVLTALTHIRQHRGVAVAVFVATSRNVLEFEGALKLALAFGARGVMLNRFNPGGRGVAAADTLLPTVADLGRCLEMAETAASEWGLPVSCSVPIQPCLLDVTAYPHVGHGFCAAGSERAYYTVDTAGNVRPCNHSPTVIGNAWLKPFADIIAGQPLRQFAAAMPASCRACARAAECQGGCKASAQVCYGDLTLEDPFLRATSQAHRLLVPGQPRMR